MDSEEQYPAEIEAVEDEYEYTEDEETEGFLTDGCMFPDEYVMPWPHYTCECYTARDAEDQEAEWRVPEAVEYLISRGFTEENFRRAIENHYLALKKEVQF